MTRRTRILVAEDEYVLALHIEEALVAVGIQVVGPVATRADAQALIDAGADFDGAILDVNLGGETIFPVAERLRMLGLPFVFVSGYDRSMLPPAFADAPHCLKPVDVQQALRALGLQSEAGST